jgi:ribosomal protein S6
MSELETKIRAYLEKIASGQRGSVPGLQEVRKAVGWDAAANVLRDAGYVARVRDGGERGLARELAHERASEYGEAAKADAKALADAVSTGEPASVSREQQERAAKVADHPAHEILQLVAEGRPVPPVERLEGFGLERATAKAVERAARIITALKGTPGRNPRLHARELANQIADAHPLPTPDPWDGFTLDGGAGIGDGKSSSAHIADSITS